MPGMIAPLAADKLEDWEAWVAELAGPRKAEFDDFNARHGLSEHRAYLQPMPDGNYATLVIHEGPGADSLLPTVMASDHPFDQWFIQSIGGLHGMDPGAPLPPLAERRI